MRKLKQTLGTLLSGVKRNGKLDLLAILILLGRIKTKNIREKTLYKIVKTCCIPLLILCVLSSTWSCSDNKRGYNENSDKFTKIIYQKSVENSTETPKSTNLIIQKVEQIGAKSLEGINLLRLAHSASAALNDQSIKKFSFYNTNIKMISIESDQKNKKLIMYKGGSEIKFAYVYFVQQDSIKKFSLLDVNNVLLYSFDVNKAGKVENLQFGKGNINTNRLFLDTDINNDLAHLAYLKFRKNGDSCPETTGTFAECMRCAIDECSKDWVCLVSAAAFPEEVTAVYGISCLFCRDCLNQ